MKVPCVLLVLVGCALFENVRSQLPNLPDVPMPPMMPPVPMPIMPAFGESRVRRSAQEPVPSPSPPMRLEDRVRRSAQVPQPPIPDPPMPMPKMKLDERYRRSAATPLTSEFKQMNIGDVASHFFGIRSKREARGGRMPTRNG